MQLTRRSLVGLGLFAITSLAQAQFAKGPDPTNASIQADGPFVVGTTAISRSSASGYGGATVYVPNTAGTYAVVAFCPGFTATQSSIAVLAKRLATHGFVVATIDTNSVYDLPDSRGTQMRAALTQVIALNNGTTIARGKIDGTRMVVTGHSMGGGGTLFASRSNTAIKAGVPLAPYSSSTKSFSTPVPQMIIGGENDTVAPVSSHSISFFNGLPDATPKVYVAINNADHFFPNSSTPNQPTSKFQIAWIKRFADNDGRYTQFVNSAAITAERNAGRLSDARIESF
jgi:dienelactone hydrolase